MDLLNTIPDRVDIFRATPATHALTNNWFPNIDGGFINALNLFSDVKAKLLRDPPSIVLASGPPFHSFVAAYYLSRYFRATFAIDYRDEWTECPFDFVSAGRFDRYWERCCLKKADVVIFTTKSHLEHQLQTFKELRREQCSVIPNGGNPLIFPDLGTIELRVRMRDANFKLLSLVTSGTTRFQGDFCSLLRKSF